jgi:hypothetical protein
MKIVKAYEAIDLYWLLNGKGTFPKLEKSQITSEKAIQTILKPVQDVLPVEKLTPSKDSVEHIIIFYKNGTFKKYKAV